MNASPSEEDAGLSSPVRASRLKHAVSWGLVVAIPVFAALYSPISLLSTNIEDVSPSDSIRAIVLIGGLAFVLLISLRLLLGNLEKASLLATLAILLILSYGHIYNLLKPVTFGTLAIGRHRILLPLALAILIVLGALIWRSPPPGRRLLGYMSFIGLTLLLWAAYPLAIHNLETERVATLGEGSRGVLLEPSADPRPDIYYIILDGHGRGDVLEFTFGYDSQGLSEELEALGFYIADESLANYGWTALSIASSLNMSYLDELAQVIGESGTDIGPARDMIRNNEVTEIMKSAGYTIVSYDSGAQEGIANNDIYLVPDFSETIEQYAILRGLSLNPFEGMLLETTMGRVPYEWFVNEQRNARALITDFNYEKQRQRILFQLSTLPEFAEVEGDYFIFAHVMSPHPPFIFGPRGEEVPNSGVFSLEDLGCCEIEEYRSRYRDQTSYLDKLLVQAVRDIVEASDIPPIIIVQGDHGPSLNMDEGDSTSRGRFERMAILNAYLLPESCRDQLYPEISPVNSFRVVLNCLGTEVEMVPDRSYYSGYWSPYDFIQVENP
ncbi:MAG: sulfatase-like hydrolase/transferase [Anaerolineales bacterium]